MLKRSGRLRRTDIVCLWVFKNRLYCLCTKLVHLQYCDFNLFRVQLFQRFEKFRVIVLGGDGSIGWVLSTIDKYKLHSKVCMIYYEDCFHLKLMMTVIYIPQPSQPLPTHCTSSHTPSHNPHPTPHILITHTHNPHHMPHTIQCMVGVVPLGTGNDMARVLGWGAQATDEEKIPQILAEMEQSSFKLLDRWSVHFSPQQNLNISHILGAHSVSINYSGTAHPYCALCKLTGKGSY